MDRFQLHHFSNGVSACGVINPNHMDWLHDEGDEVDCLPCLSVVAPAEVDKREQRTIQAANLAAHLHRHKHDTREIGTIARLRRSEAISHHNTVGPVSPVRSGRPNWPPKPQLRIVPFTDPDEYLSHFDTSKCQPQPGPRPQWLTQGTVGALNALNRTVNLSEDNLASQERASKYYREQEVARRKADAEFEVELTALHAKLDASVARRTQS